MKMTPALFKKSERQLNRLYAKEHCPGENFFDNDSPGRVHRGGWDWINQCRGVTTFYEGKKAPNGKMKMWSERSVLKLLRKGQQQARDRIIRAGGRYLIVVYQSDSVVIVNGNLSCFRME